MKIEQKIIPPPAPFTRMQIGKKYKIIEDFILITKPPIKKNDSDTASSSLNSNTIITKKLSRLWKQFVHSSSLEFWNEASKKLKLKLERKILEEGIKKKFLKYEDYQFYHVGNDPLKLSYQPVLGVELSDGKTFVPISTEFRDEVFEPMQKKINRQREDVANTINGNEFATVRIAEFIKKNGNVINNRQRKQVYDSDIRYHEVFRIDGMNYAITIAKFYSIFKDNVTHVSTDEMWLEKKEFEQALRCSLNRLPLFINSKYSTVQYIVKLRLQNVTI
ncbi:MAG: hypothetical protein GX625_00860 [Clostridiaceae bacterium]|nr:hypothetical protein [Clostridiaceae bacterium]